MPAPEDSRTVGPPRRPSPINPPDLSLVPQGTALAAVAEDARAKASMRLATAEGVPSAVTLGITQNYLVPAALALQATTFQIGLLSAIPQLGAALAQLQAPALMERLGSPKRAMVLPVFFGVLPFVAMAVVIPLGSPSMIWWLLLFATLGLVLFHLPNAAWGTWVSAMVPARSRGRFLGVRTSLSAVATIAVFMAGGLLLDVMHGRVLWGFAVIFAVAASSRVASFLLFTRMHEPPGSHAPSPRASFLASIRDLPRSNMGRFLAWYGAIMFSSSMSGPFFAVYMLRDLHFSYTTYTVLSVAPSIAAVATPFLWGRVADQRGNLFALRGITWGVSVIPILWLVSHAVPWILAVQLAAGAMWVGFALVTLNYVYGASTEAKRPTNIAYLFVCQGVATGCGNLVGGIIVPHLPAFHGYHLLTLFALSGGLRALASFALMRQVKEGVAERPVARAAWR